MSDDTIWRVAGGGWRVIDGNHGPSWRRVRGMNSGSGSSEHGRLTWLRCTEGSLPRLCGSAAASGCACEPFSVPSSPSVSLCGSFVGSETGGVSTSIPPKGVIVAMLLSDATTELKGYSRSSWPMVGGLALKYPH